MTRHAILNMTEPNFVGGFIGGALIGVASLLLLALNGRIAGVSGILDGLVTGDTGERAWRATFVAGLIAGAGLYALLQGGILCPLGVVQ